jgi:ATP-dependent exoDNAse (exonuclease V) alpha subunit
MAQGLVCRNRSVTLDSGTTLHRGDRVLLTRNAARLGVSNGDLGTIERIRGEALTVRLDRGESVVLHAEKYGHIELGYAMTTHKAQGVTVDRAFVLAGGSMQDRELTYVQASRARYEVQLFTSKLDAPGDKNTNDLDRLGRQVERSRPKVMASDVQKAGEHKTRGRREAATNANTGLELTLAI